MDKYRKQREDVQRISKEVIGMGPQDAIWRCEKAGLACRIVSNDGNGCMITADCRSDRIGLVINNGVVTDTQNG